jgi:hypothetical protein
MAGSSRQRLVAGLYAIPRRAEALGLRLPPMNKTSLPSHRAVPPPRGLGIDGSRRQVLVAGL